ncbi:hypothetical protein BTUL_0047g00490 [Botrytis tulipae]|uniref:Uncharacterized protein n=1 Tax=Botrytis tulipae TaxID=87230 RepID=A0A4Z1F1D5_9HELO|nr:hypothetical protein BTUL_0047g00490 [Botrytis tulipae]
MALTLAMNSRTSEPLSSPTKAIKSGQRSYPTAIFESSGFKVSMKKRMSEIYHASCVTYSELMDSLAHELDKGQLLSMFVFYYLVEHSGMFHVSESEERIFKSYYDVASA